MNDTTKEIHFLDGMEIKNIRRGKGPKNKFIYAKLYVDGRLYISATLDYITDVIKHNRTDLVK